MGAITFVFIDAYGHGTIGKKVLRVVDGNAPDVTIGEWSNGMNKQSEYFECVCGTDEHTLRFKLDTHDPNDVELYTSVFLNQYRGFFKRLWIAVKYLFGYKCKYGHWDCTMIKLEDADRLIKLLESYERLSTERPSK